MSNDGTSTDGEASNDQSVLADVGPSGASSASGSNQLDPSDWEAQSLCDGWTVQDVVAHLTLSTRET